MKKAPPKPSIPKEPSEYTSYRFSWDISYDRINPFDESWLITTLKSAFNYSYAARPNFDEILDYSLKNKKLFVMHPSSYDYGMEVEFEYPLESHLFKNTNYEEELQKYNKKMEEYPVKLAEYEKKFEEWKKDNAAEVEKLKQRKIEQAKKLLREAGEL